MTNAAAAFGGEENRVRVLDELYRHLQPRNPAMVMAELCAASRGSDKIDSFKLYQRIFQCQSLEDRVRLSKYAVRHCKRFFDEEELEQLRMCADEICE
jgi:hypothetical protein